MGVAGNSYGAQCTLQTLGLGRGHVNSSYHCQVNYHFDSEGTVQFHRSRTMEVTQPGDLKNYRGSEVELVLGTRRLCCKLPWRS